MLLSVISADKKLHSREHICMLNGAGEETVRGCVQTLFTCGILEVETIIACKKPV